MFSHVCLHVLKSFKDPLSLFAPLSVSFLSQDNTEQTFRVSSLMLVFHKLKHPQVDTTSSKISKHFHATHYLIQDKMATLFTKHFYFSVFIEGLKSVSKAIEKTQQTVCRHTHTHTHTHTPKTHHQCSSDERHH